MTPAEYRAQLQVERELAPLYDAVADMLLAGLCMLLAADALRATLALFESE
jgi:hypothetical protein